MLKSVIFASALLLLSGISAGCASPSEEVSLDRRGGELVSPPGDWVAIEGASSTSQPDDSQDSLWWEHFQDEKLDALIEEAFRSQPDLQIAAARVLAAAAELDDASAARWPAIGFSTSAGRQRQNFLGIDLPGTDEVISSTTTALGASLSVNWEVDLWGKLAAGEAVSYGRALAAVADSDALRLSLSGQVAIAWFTLIEALEQQTLATEIRDRWLATEERVGARAREGIRPPLDLRLARSERASAEADLTVANRRADAARRALELLIGRYPASAIIGRQSLPTLQSKIPAEIPATVLQRRPDVAAAKARLLAVDAARDQAEAGLWPSLTLTSSGGQLSSRLRDLLDGDFTVWSLAANLVGTIFDHGRRQSAVDGADARRREEEARFVRITLDAFAEVEAALRDEAHLEEQELRLRELLVESRGARDLATSEYALGLTDLLTLLSAERATANAESRVLTIERARLENRVRLLVSLGGRTRLDESNSESSPDFKTLLSENDTP